MPTICVSLCVVIDKNIGNHIYIGIQFYGYIKNISTDILENNLSSLKLIKTYKNIEKNSKNDVINNNRYFKVVL